MSRSLSHSYDSEIDREVSQAGNVCRSASIELKSISLLCSQHSISLQHVSKQMSYCCAIPLLLTRSPCISHDCSVDRDLGSVL